MDEADCLSSTDSQAMLTFLRDGGRLSERKARLFAVACCRRIWHLLHHEDVLNGVEVVERFADGQASLKELRDAEDRAMWAGDDATYRSMRDAAVAWSVAAAARRERFAAASGVLYEVRRAFAEAEVEERVERLAQADLLRDLLGPLPFRPPPIDPAVLAWQEATLVRLARAAYEHRVLPAGTLDPHHLAVLADALLDAGCTDPEILGHLRNPGPHWRGCHVVDLILGKE